MKQSTVIILLGLFILQQAFGQDKIVTNDKKELQVQIVEKSDRLVRYKMLDYDNSPLITIKSNSIQKIEYKNGVIDLMGNENPRKDKPLGVSAGVALMVLGNEGGMFTTTVDYFILPQIDVELNLGSNLYDGYYYSFGSRFHLNSNQSHNAITPFIGLLVGSDSGLSFVQVPIGLSYISKFGLQTSFSINQMQYPYSSWASIFAELRVGWRFRR